MNTSEPTVHSFGGVSGRVLREAMSSASLVTGLVLVIGLGVLSFIMTKFEAGEAFSVFVHLTVAFTLARFALNGYAGEWKGTLFSTHGGSWMETGAVGIRYLVLSLVWLLPILMLGWRPESVNDAMGEAFLGGGSKWMLLTSLVFLFMALTPPVFLIVSVSALRVKDIFDPDHWRTVFAGRLGDLFLIFVVYLGALFMTVVLFMPILIGIAAQNTDVATILALGALAFVGGLSVNLLGRLCGFFAATPHEAEEWSGEEDAAVPVADAPAASPAPTPSGLTFTAFGDPKVLSESSVPHVHPQEASRPDPDLTGGRPPLLEAKAKMDELAQRIDSDPQDVILALNRYREEYAPNPQVMHLLSICLFRNGRIEDSLAVAMEALPLCLNRGAVRLAAEIYALHLRNTDQLGLMPEVVVSMADELRRAGDLPASERAYTRVLDADSGETRAVKGLLQVAETHLHESEYGDALRIYEYLLERCGDSPLAMHMHEGLADAKRRMAKAS